MERRSSVPGLLHLTLCNLVLKRFFHIVLRQPGGIRPAFQLGHERLFLLLGRSGHSRVSRELGVHNVKQARHMRPPRLVIELQGMLGATARAEKRGDPGSSSPDNVSKRQAKGQSIVERQRPSRRERSAMSVRRITQQRDARRRKPRRQGSPDVVGIQAHARHRFGQRLDDRIPGLEPFSQEVDAAQLIPGDGSVDLVGRAGLFIRSDDGVLALAELGSEEVVPWPPLFRAYKYPG